MRRFEGKRILIIGGTNGMGLAGALRIVKEGGHVAITGLKYTNSSYLCILELYVRW